jgi:transposase-like protein
MLGFKNFNSAAITLAGIELLHRIRKGQFALPRITHQRRQPVAPFSRANPLRKFD